MPHLTHVNIYSRSNNLTTASPPRLINPLQLLKSRIVCGKLATVLEETRCTRHCYGQESLGEHWSNTVQYWGTGSPSLKWVMALQNKICFHNFFPLLVHNVGLVRTKPLTGGEVRNNCGSLRAPIKITRNRHINLMSGLMKFWGFRSSHCLCKLVSFIVGPIILCFSI